MSSEWPTVKLKDCAVFQEGYVNPSQRHPEYFDGEIKWLRAVDLNNGLVKETTRTLTRKGFESAGKSAYLFEPDTIAISKSGTIGRIGLLKDYMCGNRAVINIKVDDKKCNNLFIFFVLLAKRETIETLAVGSVQKNLYTSALGALEFKLPPRNIQDSISEVLGCLTDKVELNMQANQTLEEIAQALFKSWFVDFDPVRAKMETLAAGGSQAEAELAAMSVISAKTPEELNGLKESSPEAYTKLQDTVALFPSAMQESELGLIPKGWSITNIGELVERLRAKKRYTKKQVKPHGKIPVYEQGSKILLGFHDGDAGFYGSPEDPMFIFGDHTCVTYLICSNFDISSNVIPMKGTVRPTIWTYYAIQGKQEFQEYRRHWSEFIVKEVVLPSVEVTDEFTEVVLKIRLMLESLQSQSRHLEEMRDSLLPKLLSGEIDLSSEALV